MIQSEVKKWKLKILAHIFRNTESRIGLLKVIRNPWSEDNGNQIVEKRKQGTKTSI